MGSRAERTCGGWWLEGQMAHIPMQIKWGDNWGGRQTTQPRVPAGK